MIRTLSALLFSVAVIGGCGDESDEPTKATVTANAVDGALLVGSWPAKMAHDEQRSRFETHDGWRHLFEYDLNAALAAFAAGGDARGLARTHHRLADLYSAAALLTANATVEAYHTYKQASDPVEMTYFLGVSELIRGNTESGRSALATVDGNDSLTERARAWSTLEPSKATLAQLQAISGLLVEVKPGTEPAAEVLPHFEFKEQSEKGNLLGVNDPTALLARSAWHRLAASETSPETDQGVLGQLGRRYSIAQPEKQTHPVLGIDDAWLFGSSTLSAADSAFVAEAKAGGLASIEAWAGRSVLAAALSGAVKDGKLEPQLVQDSALTLSKQLTAAMADIAGGKAGFHRPFAQRSRIAVLQAGMIVADANDQYRDAGILRLNSFEQMDANGADPVFAMSVAAWDAGNRNPLRAEEILHQLRASHPALTAAKPALEALHLRRSRNAGPANPVH